MNRKLGLLAGVVTLALGAGPLAGPPAGAATAPSGAATSQGGSWYCFGKKATITAPDGGPNTYFGTNHADVIVTSDGDDTVRATPGDFVCTRGGNDTVQAFVTAKTSVWTKIDLGPGNDTLNSDSRILFWQSGTWQHVDLTDGTHLGVYGGPGDDEINGGAGADQLHAGTGFDTVWGAHTRDQVKDDCLLDRGAHGATIIGCANVNYRDTPYRTHAELRPAAPPITTTSRALLR